MNCLKPIAVHPAADLIDPVVQRALTELVDIQFTACPAPEEQAQVAAFLSLSGDENVLQKLNPQIVRCFHVAAGKIANTISTSDSWVRFAESAHLEKLLRGRKIKHNPLSELRVVETHPGDEILAWFNDEPIWVLRRIGNVEVTIVSSPLPRLKEKEQPFDFLNGYHFIQLLPLLHFLRETMGESDWAPPQIRACLMFDDPNLHLSWYGFISYREVIQAAKRDNFHITFATVPLDAWGAHSSAVKLFKENPDQISLLVHGNNHTREEFGQKRLPEANLRLIAQGLRRIAALENKTDLRVDRVMVPPHEALDEAIVAAMMSLGFEGVCLTLWSLRYWNPKRQWEASYGLQPAELIGNGFPVLVRFSLNQSCEGPVVISAFLGMPIVLVEHHQAVAKGLDVLSHAAKVINSLGDVRWCGAEEMLRSNFFTLRKDSTIYVKPFSCRFVLKIPEQINQLIITCKSKTGDDSIPWTVVRKGDLQSAGNKVLNETPISVTPGERLEIISAQWKSVEFNSVEKIKFSAPAFSRRILCEARDRFVSLRSKVR